jgi:serine/threonine protein kinase
MPAPASTTDFIDLVRRSDLVDGERLTAFEGSLSESGMPVEQPQAIAQRMIRDGLLTTFQAKQLLQGKWRRFLIAGKYKLLEILGVGGMGAVYLCEHIFMRRLVALKVLPIDKLQGDSSALERFYREARAAGQLKHENIVHSYDIDHEGDLHFLVMEFVEGSSLQEVVGKGGPMDVTRAAHYIRQAALGLQHAHEAGLVHRDIKPGNLLVDRTGTIKILDLGLARFFNVHKDNLTEKYDEGSVLGTADYLAPEQAINNQVDIRSDLYSLGATFYFLVTGRAPFQEGTITQKLIWHQTKVPQSIREKRPDVPAEINAIIEKLMSKAAADRYQTPAELAEALAPFTATPVPPPPEEEMPRFSPAALKPWSQNAKPFVPPTGNSRIMPSTANPATNGARTANDTPASAREAVRDTRPLDGRTRDESHRPAAPKSKPPTPAKPRSSVRIKPAPSPEPEPASRNILWITLGAGSVVGIAVVALLVWSIFRSKPAAVPSAPSVVQQQPRVVTPTPTPAAQGAPIKIRPEEAGQHLTERAIIEYQVKYVGKASTAERYFLNSLKDYRDQSNFNVTFTEKVVNQLKAKGVTNVPQYFENKSIRVTGTISAYLNRPQIEVDDLSQIEILGS